VGWDHLAVYKYHLRFLLTFFICDCFSQLLSLDRNWVDEFETPIVFALIFTNINTWAENFFEFGAWIILVLKSLGVLTKFVNHRLQLQKRLLCLRIDVQCFAFFKTLLSSELKLFLSHSLESLILLLELAHEFISDRNLDATSCELIDVGCLTEAELLNFCVYIASLCFVSEVKLLFWRILRLRAAKVKFSLNIRHLYINKSFASVIFIATI